MWEAKRSALTLVHAVPRGRGAARPTTRRSSQREGSGPGRLRDLVRARRGARRDVDRLAGAAAGPAVAGGRRGPRRSSPTGSTSTAGCSGSLDEQLDAAQRRGHGVRDGAGHRARPGRRRAPGRRRRLGAAGRAGPRGQRRGAAGRVQPGGSGLVAAAVAAGPAGRGRLRAVPRHAAHGAAARRRRPGRPRPRAVPAVVGARGPAGRRGHLRPVRPRGARRASWRWRPSGPAPSSSARTSAPSSRGCATTSPTAASWARRSCGSSATTQADAALPPEQLAAAVPRDVTTHDLPPTAGYLAGEHIRIRDDLGLLTRPVEEERRFDEADRESWLALLRRARLARLRVPSTTYRPSTVALHRALAGHAEPAARRRPHRRRGRRAGDEPARHRPTSTPTGSCRWPTATVPRCCSTTSSARHVRPSWLPRSAAGPAPSTVHP